MTRARSGFTLLEVVVALSILVVAVFALVDAQAAAVVASRESERMLAGTYLAEQKMTEALLRVEEEGFNEADIEEAGTFEDYGDDETFGDAIDFGGAYDAYQWAYTIRRVNLQVGDISGAAESLTQMGGGLSEEQQEAAGDQGRDLGDLGIQGDMITEMLAPYIREVRVVVWWGAEPDPDEGCEDCVELVTHAVNPSGTVVAGTAPDTEVPP